MNITKERIDKLDTVVKIAITKNDYKDKVDGILKDYIKKTNIPGFRKGQAAMGFIKKKYGRAVLMKEVSELVQESLYKYLEEENLDFIGHPLLKQQDNFTWNSDDFCFEFEIGLTPSFKFPLKTRKALTRYNIIVDNKIVNEEIAWIKNEYGKLISKEEISKKDEVFGVFKNDAEDIDHTITIELSELKSRKAIGSLVGKKVGDTVILKTKGLFKEATELSYILGIDDEKAKKLDIEVSFTIQDINEREDAEIDRELLFKLHSEKLCGENMLESEENLKTEIKKSLEIVFEKQSDKKLFVDVGRHFIKNIKFDLPSKFLTKWIQINSEKPLSEEEARAEYKKAEKSIRYKLIEWKLIKENNLYLQFSELEELIKNFIKDKKKELGQTAPKEEELNAIVNKTMSDKDEIKKLSEQLMNQKLITLYKEKVKLKTKKISYRKFIKEAQKELSK